LRSRSSPRPHSPPVPPVTPGESPAGAQTIGSGEECTVQAGASIETTADDEDALTAGNDNLIVNHGAISTEGFEARGISALSNNTITNHGAITSTGLGGMGIWADDNNTIVNRGTITVIGSAVEADNDNTIVNYGTMSQTGNYFGDVITADDRNTITNHGLIVSSADDVNALDARHDNIITNTGTISTTGDDAYGIDLGSRNVLTNSGTVRVTGIGINAGNDNTIVNSGLVEITAIRTAVDIENRNNLTNTGTIRTTVNFSWGIALDDDNIINNSGLIATVGQSSDAVIMDSGNVITNSGAIVATGPESSAIHMVQGDNRLNLLQGSRIVGLIEFRETIEGEENEYGNNAVTLGRGENWLMTFNEDPTLSNSLDTSGVPTAFLNGGLTVATFDASTTVFGAEAEALSDLTGVINATLHHRLTSGNPTTYLWAQGFGAKRNGDEDDDNELAGGIAGFSTPLGSSARGGLFAGYVDGSIESQRAGSVGDDSHRHVIDQESWFAGAYGRAFWGQAFADVIVTGGKTDNDSTRRILNNMALNGVEFAHGGYDGWFVNPELTLGVELPLGTSSVLVPSASVGYAGLFLDSLEETGSQAAVSLEARDVELIDGRLQLEVRTSGETSAGLWQTAIRAGVKGRSNIGDDSLSGVLAVTTAFDVALESGDDAIAGFVGGDLTFSVGPGAQIFAGGEAAVEDSGDSVFTGRAGWALRF
jgi:hypothetical protein